MKSFKTFLIIFTLFCSSCGFRRSAENTNSDATAISDEAKSDIPFESKEPEIFQTEIVVTTFLNGEKNEKNYLIARNGNKTLTVFNRGEKSESAFLNDGGKRIYFDKDRKTFLEDDFSNSISGKDETLEFLTTEWLSKKTAASFEKLETQNNLTNYRVRLNDSNASEIILTYDETIKLPVKQEFYSISGEQRNLMMTIELKNFQTSADEKLFVLPQDYKSAKGDMQQMLFYFHPGDLELSEILLIFLAYLLIVLAVLAVPVFFIYQGIKSRKTTKLRRESRGEPRNSNEDTSTGND